MKTQILHLRHFKYKNVKDIKRFRIVKLSNKQYRIDYCHKMLFLKIWDTELVLVRYHGSAEDGGRYSYEPLIFPDFETAKAYIGKACRNLIKFKKPIEKIITL